MTLFITIAETTVEPAAEPAAEVAWSRVWNHLAGGKDAYQEDRDFGAALEAAIPQFTRLANTRLELRSRLVRYLAAGPRISQFLSVGTELPLREEIHEVAQDVTPAAKVVYTDTDPVLLAYADGLLRPDDRTACVNAGAGDPSAILAGATLTLDLSRPVAVLVIGALETLTDRDAEDTIQVLGNVLAPGSRLAVVHLTARLDQAVALAAVCGEHGVTPPQLRAPQEIAALFGPLEVTEFSGTSGHTPSGVGLWCGVARVGGTR